MSNPITEFSLSFRFERVIIKKDMYIHKRRIIHILAVLVLIISIIALSAAAYIGAITIPVKVRSLILEEIEKATGKKIIFQSLRLSLIKGVVLDRPVLYEDNAVLIKAKEASARFLIVSAFRNKLIIPAVVIDEPHILLERLPDNSFNLAGIFSAEYMSRKRGGLALYRILFKNGSINFVDRTFPSPVIKKAEKVKIDIRLALPAKITFRAGCVIPSGKRELEVMSTGVYSIINKRLAADISLNGLFLSEFSDYYSTTGFSFPKGALDLKVGLEMKDDLINAEVNGKTKNLVISREGINATLNAGIKVMTEYDIKAKAFEYAGKLDIESMDLYANGTLGEIKNIKAKVEFNDSRLSSEDIRAEVFGIPWKARINIVNFKKPVFDLYANADTYLVAVKKALADNFKINFPMDIAGKSRIELAIQSEPDKPLKVNGYIQVHDGTINPGGRRIIEHLNGEAQFTPTTLKWSDIDLVYRDVKYKTSGVLTNFTSPGIQLKAASKDLSFDSLMAIDGNVVTLSKFTGKYFNSVFSASGEVYMKEGDVLDADLSGYVHLDLKALRNFVKDQLAFDKVKLEGKLGAEFALKGNVEDIKRCGISAKAKSDGISIYGFKLDNVTMDYTQTAGMGNVKAMRALFYGGTLRASSDIDWAAGDISYRTDIVINNVKLEELKKDTAIKDKDVSGNINMNMSVNGIVKDISSVSGEGKLSIEKGKLWQLNLFKGLGSLIFTSDFTEVVFTEGSCNFKIADKAFSTSNLELKSELLNLYGKGEIGFNKSVKANLKSELTEEAMDPGFKKNIATMVGRYTSIGISGTVTDPKYAMKTSPADIIGGIAKTYFEQ